MSEDKSSKYEPEFLYVNKTEPQHKTSQKPLKICWFHQHVAAEGKVVESMTVEQPAVNFGVMLVGLRDLSGMLQRGFEDIGDNFMAMRRYMSDSFAEMKRDNRQDSCGVTPGQPWRPRPEHELSDLSDNDFLCNLRRKDAPSAAGSVLDLDTWPKDEFEDDKNS